MTHSYTLDTFLAPHPPGAVFRRGDIPDLVCTAMRCGVDEAGRGPLAGPVTAAAVVLPEHPPAASLRYIARLADSKALSPRQRDELEGHIKQIADAWALGWAWPEEIDHINILQASMLAMQRACEALDAATGAETVFVDGNRCPSIPGSRVYAVIQGDACVPSIMAASILAKTARDRWMRDYAVKDSRYGFEVHKGYPTALHKTRIAEHGPCAIHRKSFRGVRRDNG